MTRILTVFMVVLSVHGAQAEEVQSAPPPTETSPEAAPLPAPAAPVEPSAPPETAAPADVTEGAPKPMQMDAATAELVALDIYLGGAGVLGPANLVGMAAYVAPAIGGLLSAWTVERASPKAPGSALKGLAASYAATLVEQFLGTGAGVAGAVAIYAALLPGYAAMVVAATALALLPLTLGVTSLAMVVAGGGMLWIGAGLLPALGVLLLGGAVASRLGVLAGDLVWEGVTTEAKSGEHNLAEFRVPFDHPMGGLGAYALIASAAGGAMRRLAWMQAVPLVGPLWFALSARKVVAERVQQAHHLSGYGEGPDLSKETSELLITRGVLGTIGQVALLGGALMVGGLGAAVLTAGLVLAFVPGVNAVVGATGLAIAAAVFGIALVPVLGIGVVSTFGDVFLGMVAPFLLSMISLDQAVGAPKEKEDGEPEGVVLHLESK